MANEDVSRGDAAAPSDPLDAAIARLEAEAARGNTESFEDELDVDDDETTETVTTIDDDPDEEEFDEDDDSDEADTPDDSEDNESDSQERQPSRKPTNTATPAKKNRGDRGGAKDDDDEPRLSRRQRGKLIEDLRREIEEAENERKKLELEMASQRAEDERLEKEVNRALGTDEELDQALEDGLSGDTAAAEKARIWKANREFYKKLVRKAKTETEQEFMSHYWIKVQDLPGVDKKVLGGKPLADILEHVYTAGVSSVETKSDETIDKLRQEVETWKGRYRALKPKSGSARRSPVGGGGTTVEPGAFDWKAKYLDRTTGMPTDEFDKLVDIYGYQAVITNKIPSRKAR